MHHSVWSSLDLMGSWFVTPRVATSICHPDGAGQRRLFHAECWSIGLPGKFSTMSVDNVWRPPEKWTNLHITPSFPVPGKYPSCTSISGVALYEPRLSGEHIMVVKHIRADVTSSKHAELMSTPARWCCQYLDPNAETQSDQTFHKGDDRKTDSGLSNTCA